MSMFIQTITNIQSNTTQCIQFPHPMRAKMLCPFILYQLLLKVLMVIFLLYCIFIFFFSRTLEFLKCAHIHLFLNFLYFLLLCLLGCLLVCDLKKIISSNRHVGDAKLTMVIFACRFSHQR